MGVFQGCSTGFWCQQADWHPTGYNRDDIFNTAFGVTAFGNDVTLEDAVCGRIRTGPPQLRQLAAQATAALLNAAHPDVNFPLKENQVIGIFVAAFEDGSNDALSAAATLLDGYNMAFCPLTPA